MNIPTIKMNDGREIFPVGLGTWKTPNDQAPEVVRDALAAGYRLIDTASEYGNEPGVGEGMRRADVSREKIMLTTKIWNAHQGYDSTLRAADQSLARLGCGHIDLYLIHWPSPAQNLYVETWRALITLRERGVARSIGVCNFHRQHLDRIIGETGVVPCVNQIELSPQLAQKELRQYHAQYRIVTESWSPLARGKLVANPEIQAFAEKYHRTAAQVILRWHVQHGLVVIPKSVSPARVRENFQLFDFQLDAADMERLDQMDSGKRLGPNPDTF